MEEHKQKLDKEYENLMQTFARELEQLKEKQNKEYEKLVSCRSVALAFDHTCFKHIY